MAEDQRISTILLSNPGLMTIDLKSRKSKELISTEVKRRFETSGSVVEFKQRLDQLLDVIGSHEAVHIYKEVANG